MKSTMVQRLDRLSTPEPNTGCLLWTGHLDKWGYGKVHVTKDRCSLAHREAWEAANGLIPVGLVVDHKCRVRACVNPDHMRIVTHVENTMCGESPAARNARKTHCKHGHPFDQQNTYNDNGSRSCRRCNADAVARYVARKKRQP